MSHSSLRTHKYLLFAILLLTALLPACAQASLDGSGANLANLAAAPTAAALPSPTAVVIPTALPSPTAASVTTQDGLATQVDPTLASRVTVERVPAVAGTSESPYWEAAPEFRRMILDGYPVENAVFKPQISVYPVDEYKAANPEAAKVIDSLKAQLASPQESKDLPFLPLENAMQMFHAHLHPLDFQNGRGLCYLTQLAQGINQVNNHELIYTCQGLTNDGKYYISSILPVSHPSLNAADVPLTEKQLEELATGFQKYLAEQGSALEAQPAESFTPDLAKLDALMRSLEVQS